MRKHRSRKPLRGARATAPLVAAGLFSALGFFSTAVLSTADAAIFREWRTQDLPGDLVLAQTRGERIVVFVECRRGAPDSLRVNLVVDGVVPPVKELPGPMASFSFDGAPPARFIAQPVDNGFNTRRIYTVVAADEDLAALLDQLRNGRVADVALQGGDPEAGLIGQVGAISLEGSFHALGRVAAACA